MVSSLSSHSLGGITLEFSGRFQSDAASPVWLGVCGEQAAQKWQELDLDGFTTKVDWAFASYRQHPCAFSPITSLSSCKARSDFVMRSKYVPMFQIVSFSKFLQGHVEEGGFSTDLRSWLLLDHAWCSCARPHKMGETSLANCRERKQSFLTDKSRCHCRAILAQVEGMAPAMILFWHLFAVCHVSRSCGGDANDIAPGPQGVLHDGRSRVGLLHRMRGGSWRRFTSPRGAADTCAHCFIGASSTTRWQQTHGDPGSPCGPHLQPGEEDSPCSRRRTMGEVDRRKPFWGPRNSTTGDSTSTTFWVRRAQAEELSSAGPRRRWRVHGGGRRREGQMAGNPPQADRGPATTRGRTILGAIERIGTKDLSAGRSPLHRFWSFLCLLGKGHYVRASTGPTSRHPRASQRRNFQALLHSCSGGPATGS